MSKRLCCCFFCFAMFLWMRGREESEGDGMLTWCRSVEKFQGFNHVHFGPRFENYVTLPIIPNRKE